MRVDSLTPSKKVPDRWYAEFQDGTRLKVDVAIIADFSLYTGRELSDDEFEELKAVSESRAARVRALRILGARSMSRGEISERLRSKGESDETAEDTADWLERIGAINDAEYAGQIVRHYASRGYGRGRIKDELYRRKIPREMWDEALSGIPEQDDVIDRLIEQKLRGKTPDRAELKRVSDMLMRRGFSWDEVKSALRRYGESAEEYE